MSPPGKRFSTWRLLPWPTSRKPVVRLSRPHTTLTGAHESDAYRLYELMFGAMKIASSRLSCIIPAMNWARVSDMPYGRLDLGSCVRDFEPSLFQTLIWRWPELPVQEWSGLAMKEMPQPLR